MRFRGYSALVTAGLLAALALSAVPVCAQSLGDIAKKEEERRKQTPPGKVYTNADLKPVPGATPPADPDAAAAAVDVLRDADKPADADKADKPAEAKPEEKVPEAKTEKYWRGRITDARTALDRDQGYAEAMQTRINALTTDFVNRDDPAQRSVIEQNRIKALAELDRLNKQIVEDRKTIADIEEEARRAGIPPGWLR